MARMSIHKLASKSPLNKPTYIGHCAVRPLEIRDNFCWANITTYVEQFFLCGLWWEYLMYEQWWKWENRIENEDDIHKTFWFTNLNNRYSKNRTSHILSSVNEMF